MRRVACCAAALTGVALLCALLSGCAMTLAIGDPARAAFTVPAPTCPGAPAVAAVKRTETVAVDKHALGPDDTTTTTIVEPAAASAVTVAEAKGAKVSETGAGVIRTVFGFLGGVARGLLTLFVAAP